MIRFSPTTAPAIEIPVDEDVIVRSAAVGPDGVVAIVCERDDGFHLYVLPIDSEPAARLESCSASEIFEVAGWLDSTHVLLSLADSTAVRVVNCRDGTDSFWDGPPVRRIDVRDDGLIVATVSRIAPVMWRGYRGGACGQILHGASAKLAQRIEAMTGNPVDAVIVEDEVWFVDDLDGWPALYSVALSGGAVRRRSTVRGVSCLRRFGEQLVFEADGRLWTVDAPSGVVSRWTVSIPGNPAPISLPSPQIHLVRECATTRRLGVLADGRLWHDSDSGLVPVDLGADYVHAFGWQDGVIHALAARPNAVILHRIIPGSETGDAVPLTPLPPWRITELEVTSAGMIGLTSDASAVRVRRDGTWEVLEEPPGLGVAGLVAALRRPVAAWTAEDDAAGRRIVVLNLETGERGEIRAAGQTLTSPSIEGDLLRFLSGRVDPFAGTGAPNREPAVLVQMTLDDALCGSEQSLTVLGRTSGPGGRLVMVMGELWHVAHGVARRLRPSDGTAPHKGRSVGDGRTLAMLAASALYVHSRGIVAIDLEPVQVDGPGLVDEVIDLVRCHAFGTRSAPWPTQESATNYRDAAARASNLSEVSEVLRRLVGELGRSHATIREFNSPRRSIPEARPVPTSLQSRNIAYLELEDVGSTGFERTERLCRAWGGERFLVLDLRTNQGGPFATSIAALLLGLIGRRGQFARPGRQPRYTHAGPRSIVVLVGAETGSGGEQLARDLSEHPLVTVLGRRTVGAGTGFRHVHPLTSGLELVLPELDLDAGRDVRIENWGLVPDIASDTPEEDLSLAVRYLVRKEVHMNETSRGTSAPTRGDYHPVAPGPHDPRIAADAPGRRS